MFSCFVFINVTTDTESLEHKIGIDLTVSSTLTSLQITTLILSFCLTLELVLF